MNRLKLCKRCLCYIKTSETICSFCGQDPTIEGADYISLHYRQKEAIQRLVKAIRTFQKQRNMQTRLPT